MPLKKRSNLRDVAHKAGVSVATVSRVLNTPAVVSETTRVRVETAIEDLSFRPSAAARAINSGRSYMVGALVPTLDNSIFARFLVALETELDAFGLSLVVASTGGDPEVEVLKAKKMIDVGTEGLIVTGIAQSDAFQSMIRRAEVPVVAISYHDPASQTPTVGYNNQDAVQIALDHLRSLGHRRIAIVHGPVRNNDRTRNRLQRILEIAPDLRDLLFETTISIEGGREGTSKALDSDPTITGVLCFSDVLAAGALYELQGRGIIVPSEMSVIGIENLPSSAFTHPPLTTVRLQVAEMGVQAARSIGAWVDTGDRPDHVHLASSLIVRETTARVRPN